MSPLSVRTGAAGRLKSGDKSPHSKGVGLSRPLPVSKPDFLTSVRFRRSNPPDVGDITINASASPSSSKSRQRRRKATRTIPWNGKGRPAQARSKSTSSRKSSAHAKAVAGNSGNATEGAVYSARGTAADCSSCILGQSGRMGAMPTLVVGMTWRRTCLPGAMPTLVVGMNWRRTCLLSRCARLASMAPGKHPVIATSRRVSRARQGQRRHIAANQRRIDNVRSLGNKFRATGFL